MAGVGVERTAGTSTVPAITDANDNYKFSDVRSVSYTRTPVLSGKAFSPASQAVTVNTLNVLSQNFIGSG